MKKFQLEFQQYEIDNIIKALQGEIQLEYRSCKWQWQEDFGFYYYTPNKRVKQLEFTIHSIVRQMKTNAETSV